MPNIIPILDQAKAYFYCPVCMANNVESEMTRSMAVFTCPLGHILPVAQYAQMVAGGNAPKMIPLKIEDRPSDHAVKKEVWVHPAIWERLLAKFPDNFNTTMGTFFDALANDSIIFIEGVDAKRLRNLGVKNGKEMVALVEKQKELEAQLDEANKTIEKIAPFIQAAAANVGVV